MIPLLVVHCTPLFSRYSQTLLVDEEYIVLYLPHTEKRLASCIQMNKNLPPATNTLLTKNVYNGDMESIAPTHFDQIIDTFSRRMLRRFGQKKLVFLITLLSILLSVLLTVVAVLNLEGIDMVTSLLIAITVPGVVAPLVSWTLVGLFIKLENMERQMRDLATYDSLTRLLTRQAFFHDAQNYLNLTERNKGSFAAMMLDIDHFKVINDTYGHHIGEKILKVFGSFLKKHLRKSDIIGRIGGEEFAVILPHTPPEDALKLAQTIRANLEKLTIMEKKKRIPLTVSIGVTSHPEDTPPDINRILKKADTALYQAKHTGRNRTVLYEPSLESN
jgi:diguanylate cyclase (GGDEF)-like protein